MQSLVVLLGVAMLSLPAAHAQDIGTPFTGDRPISLSVHAGFAWYGSGVALGGRVNIPIVDNGFIKSINNSVYISLGADIYNVSYRYRDRDGRGGPDRWDRRGFAVGIPVALQWNFYFSPEWSAFGEAGINIYLDDVAPAPSYNWGIAAAGGRYHFSKSVSAQLRVGSPYTSIGFVFDL